MSGWRESYFYRFLLAFVMFGTVIKASKEMFGRANEQPWWAVALTTLVAGALAYWTWRDIRTFEREDQ